MADSVERTEALKFWSDFRKAATAQKEKRIASLTATVADTKKRLDLAKADAAALPAVVTALETELAAAKASKLPDAMPFDLP